jgi:hypothetical protein
MELETSTSPCCRVPPRTSNEDYVTIVHRAVSVQLHLDQLDTHKLPSILLHSALSMAFRILTANRTVRYFVLVIEMAGDNESALFFNTPNSAD